MTHSNYIPALLNVDDMAELFRTTRKGVYSRKSKGMIPQPFQQRPLLWRRADVLRFISRPRRSRVTRGRTSALTRRPR